MSAKPLKVQTRFGPETQFEVQPLTAASFRTVLENRFERLKARLLERELDEVWERNPAYSSAVRRAANEAAALAWTTPYPLLVFPVLFEEKAQLARFQAERQEQVWQRSRELLAV
jgi:hypothetical protein